MMETMHTKGRQGPLGVGRHVERHLGWIFREQPVADFGIDAHFEIVHEPGHVASGRLIAAQIKTGHTAFSVTDGDSFVFRGESRHLSYWKNHSLPVIIVLYDEEQDISYWEAVNDSTVVSTGNGWKLLVPRCQRIEPGAKQDLLQLDEPPPYTARLQRLTLDIPLIRKLSESQSGLIECVVDANNPDASATMKLLTDSQDVPFSEFKYYVREDELADVLPSLFPWATLTLDNDHYKDFERDEWLAIYARWDDLDRYIEPPETFEHWRSTLPKIRPYMTIIGNRDVYRFEATLNELGRSFLAVNKYLSKMDE